METPSTYNARKNALVRHLAPKALPDTVVPKETNADKTTTAAVAGALILRPGSMTGPAHGDDSKVPESATVGSRGRKRSRSPTGNMDKMRSGGSSSSMAIIPVDPEMLKEAAESAKRKEVEANLANKPPWVLKRVQGGHDGRVRCLAMEPKGQWFASGSSDTIIKIWDLATGRCRLDLVAHKEAVRGVAISALSPYMFSCSDDHSVLNWDLETNAVTRNFHGHLSAVYTVNTHPSQENIIVTGGRDATVRVWDIRSRKDAMRFEGHTGSVLCSAVQRSEPQIISGGDEGFVYMWDLVAGKAMTRMTRHKKPVRAVAPHPVENTMVSVGADEARKWRLPSGDFYCNLNTMPHAPQGVWSCASISPTKDVLFTGSEDGAMRFYDYASHSMYQGGSTKDAKGTVLGEGGILASTFDVTGTRLFTAEGDKTIKMWQERETKE